MAAFTQRQTTPKKGQVPRGSVIRKFESSDDDDSSDVSDSDEEQSWKRRKSANVSSGSHLEDPRGSGRYGVPASTYPSQPSSRGGGGGRSAPGASGRRKNNIWGSVVAEQNQETVERELTQFGVEGEMMERDVESYYKPSQQLQLGLMADLATEPAPERGRKMVKPVGEEEDGWLEEQPPPPRFPDDDDNEEESDCLEKTARPDLRERLMQRGSMVADQFRRSNVKKRLGVRHASEENEPETIMKSVTIDPESEPKEVAGQLAYSLQEPKRHLMLRIVKTLGIKKSIEIWKKTEEVEQDGGMLIRNQSRKRSPGGVFIQLMKTDPDISPADIKVIFSEENAAFNAEKKKRRRHTRKHKNTSGGMDVDHHDDEDTKVKMEAEGEDIGDAYESHVSSKEIKKEEEDCKVEFMDPFDTGENDFDFLDPEDSSRQRRGVEGLPPPKQECADLTEHNEDVLNFMSNIKEEDIPKRNEDSEPEEGEVLDDDDVDVDHENTDNNNVTGN